jgi:hypothetical protein
MKTSKMTNLFDWKKLLVLAVLILFAGCSGGGSGAATALDSDTRTSLESNTDTSPDADSGTSPDEDTGTSPDADNDTPPDEDTSNPPDADTGSSGAAAAWIPALGENDWSYRQQISLSAALADADQTGFPCLIRITDIGNPVFSRAQADGSDIVFTDSDGTTELMHEIETFDPVNRVLEIWVRLPLLSAAADTVIFMYYGNAGLAVSMENPAAVWDNDYALVYHLDNRFEDSTGTSDATDVDTVDAAGKVARARNFDGVDDYIMTHWGDDAAEKLQRFTFACWVYADYLPNTDFDEGIVHKTQGGMLSWSHHNDKFRGAIGLKASAGGWQGAGFNIGGGDLGRWVYLVGTYTSGSLRAYKDGALEAENTRAKGAPDPKGENWAITIGKHAQTDFVGPEHFFGGSIDEVRISRVDRSGAWIAASYRNQADPQAYQQLSAEEAR